MANLNKRRGDAAERRALAVLRELAADLMVPGAAREFGAGRAADVGDLRVFPDVAVQVRRLLDTGKAVHTAAADAVTQAANRQVPLALGMVPMIGARPGTVRWVAACRGWPVPVGQLDVTVLRSATTAVAHARRDDGQPRCRRLALVRRHGRPEVFVAPIEAWVRAYRALRTDPASAPPAGPPAPTQPR